MWRQAEQKRSKMNRKIFIWQKAGYNALHFNVRKEITRHFYRNKDNEGHRTPTPSDEVLPETFKETRILIRTIPMKISRLLFSNVKLYCIHFKNDIFKIKQKILKSEYVAESKLLKLKTYNIINKLKVAIQHTYS